MPAREYVNELDEITWRLENIFRTDPKLMRKWKPKVRRLEFVATNTARLLELAEAWESAPQSLLRDFNTDESAPFVKVCLGLSKRRKTVSPVSLCLWWRRMVATGNASVLTYFSWDALERLCVDTVTGSDLLRACTDNISILENIESSMDDGKSVDFRIRELLGGISMQADVDKAWRLWAVKNHPDKGGDPELFLRVKVVYDEWRTTAKEESR